MTTHIIRGRTFECHYCGYTRHYGEASIRQEPRILIMTSLIDPHGCKGEKEGKDTLYPIGTMQ